MSHWAVVKLWLDSDERRGALPTSLPRIRWRRDVQAAGPAAREPGALSAAPPATAAAAAALAAMSATPASMPMSTNMSTPIFVVAREPDAGGFAAVPLSLLAASPSQSPALAPLPHARTPAPAPFALCPAAPTPRSAAAAYSSAAIPQHGHLHHPAPPATLMSQPSDISVTDAPPSFLVRLSSIISDTSFE